MMKIGGRKTKSVSTSQITAPSTYELTTLQRLRREIKVWQSLDHENILPLYGTITDFGLSTAMVCPWAENGNLTKYLELQGKRILVPERFRLVSRLLLLSLYHLFLNTRLDDVEAF
jgi:serine/threonine protein kinase